MAIRDELGAAPEPPVLLGLGVLKGPVPPRTHEDRCVKALFGVFVEDALLLVFQPAGPSAGPLLSLLERAEWCIFNLDAKFQVCSCKLRAQPAGLADKLDLTFGI